MKSFLLAALLAGVASTTFAGVPLVDDSVYNRDFDFDVVAHSVYDRDFDFDVATASVNLESLHQLSQLDPQSYDR